MVLESTLLVWNEPNWNVLLLKCKNGVLSLLLPPLDMQLQQVFLVLVMLLLVLLLVLLLDPPLLLDRHLHCHQDHQNHQPLLRAELLQSR